MRTVVIEGLELKMKQRRDVSRRQAPGSSNGANVLTKVMQRIPIELTFSADTPPHGRIRPGMSVTATAELKDIPGALSATL
ncbi:TPA: hypothetical protein QEM85_005386 [Pseudomonas putida]|nr:hypothetical protein [Pseudomonas putida]HDS0936675.1 hypothetical protein [Pseudomonas putida]HDS1786448.1 hypothetical protein [Pseudomonas putida]HDS3801937.1 hypothetical protein [Pseudomonas putida]